MNNLSRNELTKALVKGLKLDDNIFNYQAVAEEIEQIQEFQFMDFYKAVMNADTFGNGIKAIIQTAEQFKPTDSTQSNIELKAKELIQWCENANSQVFDNANKSGRTFDDELRGTKFTSLSDNDLYVLNQVKPYSDHKSLIGNIRGYQTSEEALKAFMSALKYTPMDSVQIANPINKLMIKRG